ncbi:hypothetical protein T439DRAFT_288909 [Meredithblackwellia eburnea MCA 4105]
MYIHLWPSNKLPFLSTLTSPNQQFLDRQRTLSLYRSFLRASRGLGDLQTRQEVIAWVREDFEKYKEVTDPERIKHLHSLARKELKGLNSTTMLVGNDGEKWRGKRPTGKS